MAKGKKKENLTPEERLQAALVPDLEQPYKVSENWCWTYLGTICSLENGNKHKDEELVYFDVKTLRSAVSPQKRNNGIVVNKNQKVILVDGENSGEVFNIPYRGYMGSTFRIINISNYAEEIYIRYFIGYNQDKLKKNKVGSAIPHLNKELFFGLELPFPPLKEQQRIVERIESLFVKLDEAKQKAQDALDSFETRKAAILRRAFTGELTAQWRKENGVGMESWKKTALQEVCEKIVCGKTPTGFICPTGKIPYLKVYNIVNNKISFESAPQFIPKEIHEGRLKSSILKPNDIVMNIVGPPLRKIAIIPADYPEWNMNQAIVRFRPLAPLKHRFLYYALINPETLDNVISETRGVVGQANISVAQSRNLIIPLPSINEQIEIIRILDDLLAKEQQAREAAEAVIEQIDVIKKSILARAFCGELDTNDPAEESSVELVRKILEKNDEMETKAQTLFKAKS